MSIVIRNYRDSDQESLIELRQAAAAADQLHAGLRVTEPQDYLYPLDLHYYNLFLAQDEGGRIVSSARLRLQAGAEQAFFDTFLTVHPDWRQAGIERLLLERTWERAEECRRDLQSKRVYFLACCATHQRRSIALFEKFGLRAMCYGPHMIYQPLRNLAQPRMPAGIEFSSYIKGRDDESALDTMNEAFAEDREFVPLTQERWGYYLASPLFREDLNLVALAAEEVIGLCLSIISEDRMRELGRADGYVNTLCVRQAYRRQGLGTALLLAGLHALKGAGMESATLDTEIDNPSQAMRLYDKVGFREIWRWVDYSKEMV